MIDVTPPAEGATSAPDWYPDPETPGILRWWDGESWSSTDIRPAGEDGYPWWHPDSHRQRIRSALEAIFIKVSARIWRR